MTGWADLHLPAALGAALEELGWSPMAAGTKELVPTVARGHNAVLVAPPAPAWARPLMAAVAARAQAHGGRALVLCPPAAVEAWHALVAPLAAVAGIRAAAARTPGRVTRLLREDALDLLVGTPEAALALLRRSALQPARAGSVVLAWPEQWESTEPLADLMADVPREAQRVIVTADPAGCAPLLERYAWRALPFGQAVPDGATALERAARVVATSWADRAGAAAVVLDLLDPASAAVWCADHGLDAALDAALPPGDPRVTRDRPGTPVEAEVVIFADLPPLDAVAHLPPGTAAVFLAPPGTEPYVARLVAGARPLRLPGSVEAAETASAARRTRIAERIAAGALEGALLQLAPLLERFDAARVAAALYELWQAAPAAPPEPAPAATPARGPARAYGEPVTVKLFVTAGKRDGVTPADLVAVLTKDVKVPRQEIGRIELQESFALVEVPAANAGKIAEALTGRTLRRRRITARLEREERPARAPRAPRTSRAPRPPR